MTQLGGLYNPRVEGTERAMQYLTLEPCKVPEALKLYAEAFQAKLIDHYEDQSVQLKILNSYVIITPCAGARSDSFLELPTDLNSIRRIRQDKRFVETDLKRPTENESVMLKDPFGIFFLLIEKKKKKTRSVVDDHGLLYRRMRNSIAYGFPQDISPNELCTIKLTALFVTRYGMGFRKALKKIAPTTDQFGFLELNHIRRSLFIDFVQVYTSILEPSEEVGGSCDFMGKALELFFHILQRKKVKMGAVMEVDAFTGGVDYFAYKDVVGYSDVMPRPQHRSVMIAQLEGQTLRTPLSAPFPSWCSTIFYVSPEVLGIIKVTALFVARYGKRIGWELMEEEVVKKNPLFSFLDPSDSGFPCYNMVVKVYSKVLFSFEQVYTTDIVLQRYFQCLQWDEEKDEPKDLDDLYSFVECVDSFAQMEDEEFYHKMGNREAYVTPLDDRTAMIHHRTHVYPFHDPTSLVQRRREHVLYPFHDETSPANVQEEGSSTIKVSVPTLDGREVIKIAVESWLLEKVASLKEKIAKTIQMQADEVKLRAKSVEVLREDKSLADNNVEAGEILTATWRFSRWEED